jgi:hypothetical protein
VIDPNWVLQDLDPRTWRAIGRFFMPGQYIAAAQPDERGLFILHDGGRRPRMVDTLSGLRGDLGIVSIDDPRGLAQALHARGEWDRVHVIDKRHLAHVGRTAARADVRCLLQPRLQPDLGRIGRLRCGATPPGQLARLDVRWSPRVRCRPPVALGPRVVCDR